MMATTSALYAAVAAASANPVSDSYFLLSFITLSLILSFTYAVNQTGLVVSSDLNIAQRTIAMYPPILFSVYYY